MPLKITREENPTLNLTPMIDIVFLLIIFFMVGTKFSERDRKLSLSIPEVTDSKGTLTPAPTKRTVHVYRNGKIILDRKEVDLETLTVDLEVARQEYAELGVVVRGDAKASWQQIATVLNACRQAGIINIDTPVQIAQGISGTLRE
ncbi:MAG: biopolymer transporter ExbD [Pirellulaceae bacterium]|nr:biopolymer transporter ExbD [Pirellulaceae bacterium]